MAMTHRGLMQTVTQLHQHVKYRLGHDREADEKQIIDDFLAALDLSPAEHFAVLHAYRDTLKRAMPVMPTPAPELP